MPKTAKARTATETRRQDQRAASTLDIKGYALADISLSDEQCDHLIRSLPPVTGGRGGVRNLITHPTVLRLLLHPKFGDYLWSEIGRDLVAVKATMFDKELDANWYVQWHQDRSVAVKQRVDTPGYGPWTSKAGVVHVEPPVDVLAQIVAVRIHLDACGSENGPLRVVPGSHASGKLTGAELEKIGTTGEHIELTADRGAIHLMRPLLVHSSARAMVAAHRRVLHIELAPAQVIWPLQFEAAVPLRRAA